MLIQADARHIPLKDGIAQCCITSPPYYGLRNYGLGDRGIGLEATIEEYVANIVQVFREVSRVLRDDGTVWLNAGFKHDGHGNLIDLPGILKDALVADGWYCKCPIVWQKPSVMPTSQQKRPTIEHEMIWLLAKDSGTDYFYDPEGVREISITGDVRKPFAPGQIDKRGNGHDRGGGRKTDRDGTSRNLRSVWTIPADGSGPRGHYAKFPRALVERCIKAGTSEKGACAKCGAAWERIVEKKKNSVQPTDYEGAWLNTDPQSSGRRMLANMHARRLSGEPHDNPFPTPKTIGWHPSCSCDAPVRPCIVLDCFVGSGTTVMTARDLGRTGIGIDLKYFDLSKARIYGPLFAPTINA